MVKEPRPSWSFYGEDAAVDDGAKMGQSVSTPDKETHYNNFTQVQMSNLIPNNKLEKRTNLK
ncbi:hypothetical protein YC2023_100099 [Brassica napus]